VDSIDIQRKLINKKQSELRTIMTTRGQHEIAIRSFLLQHAALHSKKVSNTYAWSFEDSIIANLTEDHFRRMPKNEEHSIAWCIWHIARIEDIAMNYLVADTPPVFVLENWQEQINIAYKDSGNEMKAGQISSMSKNIDLDALRNYRVAVGQRTREIVAELKPGSLIEKVKETRIIKLIDAGAVSEAAYGITDYWSRRNIAGILLMPATRHNLVHLNEALKLKRKRV
jgi:hypothetical protein